jgi:histidinol-phosphate/aromatic aminotransferase/cobyric acid decarboxylase-like protein
MTHAPSFSGLDFTSYAQLRKQLLVQGGFLDCGQTNVYRALAQRDPEQFGLIAPSQDPQASYRCHLAEQFRHYLGLDDIAYASRCLISHGVRHSLSLIFSSLAAQTDTTLILPRDVYPVYAQLAQQAGIDFDGYEARTGLPWHRLNTTRDWTLLVCDPLKPWGSYLGIQEIDRLVQVAIQQGGTLLIDAAYDIHLAPIWRDHLDADAPIAFLASLSKGWLLPGHGGLVVTSDFLANTWREVFQSAEKDLTKFQVAFAALSEHRTRIVQVSKTVGLLRGTLVNAMKDRRIPLSQHAGYFAISPLSCSALWEQGVLGIPPLVFGSSYTGSVLSAL